MLCRWLLEATGLSTHHRKPLTYTINFEDVISWFQMADSKGSGFYVDGVGGNKLATGIVDFGVLGLG